MSLLHYYCESGLGVKVKQHRWNLVKLRLSKVIIEILTSLIDSTVKFGMYNYPLPVYFTGRTPSDICMITAI